MSKINDIKCECGHINPEGTVLCEACGKPIEGNQHIDGNDKQKLLNMRYEGSSRRSKTYNKSIIDKIWGFFSSVKVGVWLIVIALVTSAIGTIFPQKQYIPPNAISRDPSVYYEATYGILGKIYYQLGFDHLYSSWWYLIVLALVGISLVVCSIDRYVPLRKALKNQRAKRHKIFLSRQRLYSETEQVTDEEKEIIIKNLKRQHYKVRNENGHILAEKGRFSRWGPYVNHIGLIIILLAAILRMTPLFYLDDYVWVRDGEQKVLPSTNEEYYIQSNKFILETYDDKDDGGRFKDALDVTGEVPKNYQTDVTIYKNIGTPKTGTKLKKITDGSIKMNHPLKFDGYTLYQSGFQKDEFKSLTFQVQPKPIYKDLTFHLHTKGSKNEVKLGSFTVDLDHPKKEYQLDSGFRVVVNQYYPQYHLEDGKPVNDDDVARNPAFVFFMYPPESQDPEVSFVGFGKNIAGSTDNQYAIDLDDYTIDKKATNKVDKLGTFTIDLSDPQPSYTLKDGTKVEINNYYPKLEIDDGKMKSTSKFPKNPAFKMSVKPFGHDQEETSFIGIDQHWAISNGNQYQVKLTDYELHDVSGITVRRDYSLPFFIFGALIFMLGVIQGMYWYHRRIWIRPEKGGILLAGHTNKNWFGLKKDIKKVIEHTNVNMVVDQQELIDKLKKD